MRRTFLALGTLTALTATACTGGSGDGASPTIPSTSTVPVVTTAGGPPTSVDLAAIGRSLRFDAALTRFSSCDDLLAWVKKEAASRVGPYGFGYGGPIYWEGEMAAGSATTVAAATPSARAGDDAASGGQAGIDYSTTNVQEAGVDEPDIVKTDGTRIVALANGRIHLIDASGTPRLLDSDNLPTDTYATALFLSGDRAFVFGQGSYPVPQTAASTRYGISPYSAATTITEFDIGRGDLRTVGTLRIEGSYLSAREVGGTARIVISAPPSDLPFVYPQGPAGEERARRANQEAVAESTIDQWLPQYELDLVDGGERTGTLTDCSEAHAPTVFAGFSTISVVTIDLTSPLGLAGATSIFADGQTVYASADNLYVATQSYIDPLVLQELQNSPQDWQRIQDDYGTSIHKFSITGDEPARYLASGAVKGHLLNQFSLSEQGGNLRIATTTGSPWGSTTTSQSHIVVLAQAADRLDTIGEVGGMGQGEQIYSVRFVGDTAYVVTFRQTDPFYTVDLSDPANPRVAGELKIPGYSGYLHPIDATHVLGIGQDATDEGRVTGTKVTLFDVSDLADPQALDTWSLPSSYTDAQYDSHAFLYWEPLRLAVLPINAYNERFAGAVVLKVGDASLEEVGRVTQLPDTGVPTSDCTRVPQATVDQAGYGGNVYQVCGPDDAGGLSGYSCAVDSADLFATFGIDPPAGARIEGCYPYDDLYGSAIVRTLVIGPDLWTLSPTAIQANDLATLTPGTRLALN